MCESGVAVSDNKVLVKFDYRGATYVVDCSPPAPDSFYASHPDGLQVRYQDALWEFRDGEWRKVEQER